MAHFCDLQALFKQNRVMCSSLLHALQHVYTTVKHRFIHAHAFGQEIPTLCPLQPAIVNPPPPNDAVRKQTNIF